MVGSRSFIEVLLELLARALLRPLEFILGELAISDLLELIVAVHKLLEARVADVLAVEGERKSIEWILVQALVVHLHIEKQGFFVA